MTKASIKDPQVTLVGVEIGLVSMQAAELNFNLRIHNPNGFDLKLQGVEYSVAVNDRQVFSGENQQEFIVPANRSGQIRLPLRFEYEQVFNSIAQALSEQKIRYHVTGSAHFGLLSVPFVYEGSFDLNLQ